MRRGFPWSRVGPYVVAQVLGAFAGAAVVYLTYREAFAAFDGGVRQMLGAQGTAGIFATYPAAYLSTLGGFVDQVVGTALLVAMVFASATSAMRRPRVGLAPVFVGLTVMAIGMGFGVNAGYAINPARDFGPRLFTALAGWGGGVFTAGQRLLVGPHRRAVPRRYPRWHGVRPVHPGPTTPRSPTASAIRCSASSRRARRADRAPGPDRSGHRVRRRPSLACPGTSDTGGCGSARWDSGPLPLQRPRAHVPDRRVRRSGFSRIPC